MNIYKFKTDSNQYHGLTYPEKGEEESIFDRFEGKNLGDEWEPIIMEVREAKKQGGFPSFEMPVLSEKAWEVLKPLIQKDVEALPLIVEKEFFGEMGGDYYALNVLSIITCLDESMSEFVKFSNGEVMRIVKHVFMPESIEDVHFFRIKAGNTVLYYDFYVSEDFKNLVEKHNLKGLLFQKINE